MPGYRRKAYVERGGQLRDSGLPFRESLDDRATRLVGQRAEHQVKLQASVAIHDI